MSSTNLEVVFEGPAVKTGTIDARLLACSLMGYSEVFTRSNALVNGEESEAAVLVQSDFKPGSFVANLEFVQNLTEHARQLITSHQFLDATGLATIIGFLWKNRESVDSLLELFKWGKGKKPDKAVAVGNNIEVTFGVNKKTVNKTVYNLYGDAAIRTALSKLTSPLRQAAIDRISVKQDGKEQAAIEKSEAEYFETEPLQLESDSDAPMEGERDAVLIVSKLSFTEGTTWTFFERGATVVAKIEDDRFWQQVHQHNLTFGEGDQLKVRLVWKIERKKKLMQRNTIVKVVEVMERPRQMRLDGGKDDEIVSPTRIVRFED